MKWVITVVMVGVWLPGLVLAAIPAMYTNENIHTSEHDQPVSINRDAHGGFYGYTLTGKLYTQQPIENVYHIRLHKFAIDEAFWYVSDRGVIAAPSDLAALSIYFTRA